MVINRGATIFNTAFLLTSLSKINDNCASAREELRAALLRGYQFWQERCFSGNGWPKYYCGSTLIRRTFTRPQVHCGAGGIARPYPNTFTLAEKIAGWATEQMRTNMAFIITNAGDFIRSASLHAWSAGG
jgi:hypothetical protein